MIIPRLLSTEKTLQCMQSTHSKNILFLCSESGAERGCTQGLNGGYEMEANKLLK